MSDQLENRARALCAADVRTTGLPEKEQAAAIERYWPVVAVEIAGGNVTTEGLVLPADFEQRQREFIALVRIARQPD